MQLVVRVLETLSIELLALLLSNSFDLLAVARVLVPPAISVVVVLEAGFIALLVVVGTLRVLMILLAVAIISLPSASTSVINSMSLFT
jgi:hypothetical protein